jgi:hypothetical protein
MAKTWSELAREAIAAILSDYTESGGDLIYLDADDRERIKKRIDDAYPFGERSNFPYKAWLIERRSAFIALGIPVRSTSKKPNETSQMDLFNTSTD